MANLSVSIASLIGAVNSTPVVPAAENTGDGFRSLLDIGGEKPNADEALVSAEGKNRPSRETRDEQRDENFAAAAPAETIPPRRQEENGDKNPKTEKTDAPIEQKSDADAAAPQEEADADNQVPAAPAQTGSEPDAGETEAADGEAVAAGAVSGLQRPHARPLWQLRRNMNQLEHFLDNLSQLLFGPAQEALPVQGAPQNGQFPMLLQVTQVRLTPEAAAHAQRALAALPKEAYALLEHMQDLFARLQTVMQSLASPANRQEIVAGKERAQALLAEFKTSAETLQKHLAGLQESRPQGLATTMVERMMNTLDRLQRIAGNLPLARRLLRIASPSAPAENLPKQNEVKAETLLAQAKEILGGLDAAAPLRVKVAAAAPETAAASAPTQNNTASSAPATAQAPDAPAAVIGGSQASSHNAGQHPGGKGGDAMPQQPLPVTASGHQAPSASAAGQASFSRLLSKPSHAPLAEQVMFHIKTAMADGTSKIRIQLEPAELGRLDIKLQVDAGGKTGIAITADNKSTLDLLQRDTGGLMRALADAGLKADNDSLSFNLRGEQGQQQEHEQARAPRHYPPAAAEEEPMPLEAISRSYVVNLAEGIDIKI